MKYLQFLCLLLALSIFSTQNAKADEARQYFLPDVEPKPEMGNPDVLRRHKKVTETSKEERENLERVILHVRYNPSLYEAVMNDLQALKSSIIGSMVELVDPNDPSENAFWIYVYVTQEDLQHLQAIKPASIWLSSIERAFRVQLFNAPTH